MEGGPSNFSKEIHVGAPTDDELIVIKKMERVIAKVDCNVTPTAWFCVRTASTQKNQASRCVRIQHTKCGNPQALSQCILEITWTTCCHVGNPLFTATCQDRAADALLCVRKILRCYLSCMMKKKKKKGSRKYFETWFGRRRTRATQWKTSSVLRKRTSQ